MGWGCWHQTRIYLVWLGQDQRNRRLPCPIFRFTHTLVRKVQSDGTVVPVLIKTPGDSYSIYQYLTDKNDFSLRALEKTAIKAMMNHIATYNTANGDKKTLVGVDVANENSVTHIHGVGYTV